jgi:hypothetical protein
MLFAFRETRAHKQLDDFYLANNFATLSLSTLKQMSCWSEILNRMGNLFGPTFDKAWCIKKLTHRKENLKRQIKKKRMIAALRVLAEANGQKVGKNVTYSFLNEVVGDTSKFLKADSFRLSDGFDLPQETLKTPKRTTRKLNDELVTPPVASNDTPRKPLIVGGTPPPATPPVASNDTPPKPLIVDTTPPPNYNYKKLSDHFSSPESSSKSTCSSPGSSPFPFPLSQSQVTEHLDHKHHGQDDPNEPLSEDTLDLIEEFVDKPEVDGEQLRRPLFAAWSDPEVVTKAVEDMLAKGGPRMTTVISPKSSPVLGPVTKRKVAKRKANIPPGGKKSKVSKAKVQRQRSAPESTGQSEPSSVTEVIYVIYVTYYYVSDYIYIGNSYVLYILFAQVGVQLKQSEPKPKKSKIQVRRNFLPRQEVFVVDTEGPDVPPCISAGCIVERTRVRPEIYMVDFGEVTGCFDYPAWEIHQTMSEAKIALQELEEFIQLELEPIK